jgi:hypothetical protein
MTVTSSDQPVQNLTSLTAQNSIAAALFRITRPVIRLLAPGRPATIFHAARRLAHMFPDPARSRDAA